MRYLRERKADLSLSINAIVVLILAITMLGLGLTFLRGTFTKTTQEFASVSESAKQQVIDEIKSSGDKVAFNLLETSIKRGETKDLFFGIHNVFADKETFTIHPRCTAGLVGGDPTKITLQTFTSWDVNPGDTEVLKLTVSAASDAKSDSYACELDVTSSKSSGVQVTTGQNERTFTYGANEYPYTTKKFFVKVE